MIIELITPFEKSGAIDGRGLGKLLDRLSPYGQAVFLASPNMGEGKNLSAEMRAELLEKALVVLRRRIPIFIWVTQKTEEETGETIKALNIRREKRSDNGQVFWVDTPLFYHSNRGLPDHYRSLCDTFHEPFILHNDPQLIHALGKSFKRNNIRTAILKDLIRIDSIAGLIFSGSLDRAHHYQKACRGKANFRIYDGDENQFLDHPSMSGGVSAGANLAPNAWHKITQSSLHLTEEQAGYPSYLEQVWEFGLYLRNLKAIYEKSPVPLVKNMLFQMGIINSAYSTFSGRSSDKEIRELKELMSRYGDYQESRD